MPCPDNNLLVGMLERGLDPADLHDLEAHFDSCFPCQQMVAVLAGTPSNARAMGSPRPDEAGMDYGWLSPPVAQPPRPDYAAFVPVDQKHYVLGEQIARGGMGRIRIARDLRLGRDIAIKETLVNTAELSGRFEREVRLTARLQHPSIVNVYEAGVWPNGAPFFAMKLVSGRSLDKVIAEATTLDDRLALLPNVLAVADALAYAHGQGVIHRDLKPQNVLVGSFGETVVIDWGLAKDLASTLPDLPSEPERAGGASGSDAYTAVGEVIGTPRYMCPEQALGKPVDARADVYSLGALLYQLLAGRPPVDGANAKEVLAKIVDGPLPSLATVQPDVPPDLLAIVAKAMAFASAARYPSAREFAEDLRRFQTGQLVGAHRYSLPQLLRRWLRRHRAAASVAAVAALVLIALGALSLRRIVRAEAVANERRAEAQQQRELAQLSRGDAEDLMSFMLVDLRDKLKPLGKLELLHDVAKKAVAYYDRKGDQLSDEELGRRSLARRNLGDVLSASGHTDDALAEYRTSLRIAEQLVANDPTNAAKQVTVANCHDKVGQEVFTQGNATAALAEYRAARAIRESLVANDPTNADRQAELSISHNQIGKVVLAQGDAAGALAEYRASLAIALKLTANDPKNTRRREELSLSRETVGDALSALGDSAVALVEYRASLAIAESLAAEEPTNAERQWRLARGHQNIGNILSAQRDWAGALVEYRALLAIVESLAAKDPTNAVWQRGLSVAHNKVGNALRARKDLAGALREYQADQLIASRLAAKDPTNAELQRDLTVVYNKIGNVLLDQGNNAEALKVYQASVAVTEALTAKDPTNAEWQRDLSVGHNKVGDARQALGDYAGALADYRAARSIIEALAVKDPNNAELQVDRSVSCARIGDVLLAQRNKKAARAEFRSGLALAQSLLIEHPDNADAREMVTTFTTKVATCCGARQPRQL
jgi:serine/threonine protein kinase